MKKLISGTKKTQVTKALRAAAKTNAKKVHVVSRGNKWATKTEGAKRATRVFTTKSKAVKAAKFRVKKGSATAMVVHKRDGRITKKR